MAPATGSHRLSSNQHHPLLPPRTDTGRVPYSRFAQSHPRHTVRTPRKHSSTVHVAARQGQGGGDDKFVDTRIHWTSPDDGWIGVPGSSAGSIATPPPPPRQSRYGKGQGGAEAGWQARQDLGSESDTGSDTEGLRRAVGNDLLLRMAAEGSDNHYT